MMTPMPPVVTTPLAPQRARSFVGVESNYPLMYHLGNSTADHNNDNSRCQRL
jgi:hypothetical protein